MSEVQNHEASIRNGLDLYGFRRSKVYSLYANQAAAERVLIALRKADGIPLSEESLFLIAFGCHSTDPKVQGRIKELMSGVMVKVRRILLNVSLIKGRSGNTLWRGYYVTRQTRQPSSPSES